MRGNTTQIGTEYFGYDALGHLAAWIDYGAATPVLHFEVLDAEDRRVARYVGTAGTAYLYDGDLPIQEENLTTGLVTRERVYGPGQDRVVGERIGGVPFAIHSDELSTPYASTDGVGSLVESYDTEPFGKTTTTLASGITQSLDLRIGLHGAWRDPTTGRLFMRARTYDPELGRFLSKDPIGVWGDVLNGGNAYGFVGNSPTIYIDPYGLWGWFSSIVESVSSAVSTVASTVRDVVAGAADGAIQAITLGMVDTPIVGNLVGADTTSVAYSVGTVLGEVATNVAINAATAGTCAALSTGAKIFNAVGDAVETARDIADAVQVVGSAMDGNLDLGSGLSLVAGAAGPTKRSSACFPAGTLVWTELGLTPIEEIEPGESVHVYDERTGSYTTAAVTSLFVKDWVGDLVTIQVDGTSVTATGNHPFFVVEGVDLASRPIPHEFQSSETAPLLPAPKHLPGSRWVEARHLLAGDLLLGPASATLRVSATSVELSALRVYNLNVTAPDTYLISSLGLVVHNTECKTPPATKRRGGETDATADGRRAHGNYGTALGDSYDTKVTLPSGRKPDAVNWEEREVRELKPDNPRAVRRGEKQVESYRRELEELTGEKWTSAVDTYQPKKKQ